MGELFFIHYTIVYRETKRKGREIWFMKKVVYDIGNGNYLSFVVTGEKVEFSKYIKTRSKKVKNK